MTSSTTTADLTQEFIAKVRGLAIDTLIFVENFTDEGGGMGAQFGYCRASDCPGRNELPARGVVYHH